MFLNKNNTLKHVKTYHVRMAQQQKKILRGELQLGDENKRSLLGGFSDLVLRLFLFGLKEHLVI